MNDYDPLAAEFVSQDPLEKVDGASVYRAYFVRNGLDPSGMHLRVVGINESGQAIHRDLHNPTNCYISDPDGQQIAGYGGLWTRVTCPVSIKDGFMGKSLGIGRGIEDKTLTPVDGVNNRTFTAENCMGVRGCNAEFTFDKAYVGTRGRDKRLGTFVVISAQVSDCSKCCCDTLKMVSVVADVDGDGAVQEPDTRRRRDLSGWGDRSSPSRGWSVDSRSSSPFYGSERGRNRNIGGCVDGSSFPATIFDAPGDLARNERTNRGAEFMTCAVCERENSRKILGCIRWGYMIDDDSNVMFKPNPPTVSCSAPQEFQDAYDRFGGFGNTDDFPINF